LADITTQSPTELEHADDYAPYVSVSDRNIKADLCNIAKLFQYIDNGFAEYFQAVISRLPRDTVEGHLQSARSRIEKKRALSDHRDQPDLVLDLGDLGNYCEKVFNRMGADGDGRVLYDVTDCTQKKLLHYLQDYFEIPYWQLMLDLFLQQSGSPPSLSATVVFRVLSSLKTEILHKRSVIRRATLEGNRAEDIGPLLKGIDARVAVLEDVWHKDTSDLEASELFQALFQTTKPERLSPPDMEPPASAKAFSAWPENQQSNPKVNKHPRLPRSNDS
jgi:hypothetical protein